MIRSITVWSGVVANCGESSLADMVRESSHCLESLLYYPRRTKGGTMLRPCYSDREGACDFPKLRHIGMRWEVFSGYTNPIHRYLAPNLEKITFLIWDEY